MGQLTSNDYIRCTYNHSFLTFSSGTLYSYLAGVGWCKGEGAFSALSRGYTYWSSGQMEELGINTHNPYSCHVRCLMKQSMKRVYILLTRDGKFAAIAKAKCHGAAGYV